MKKLSVIIPARNEEETIKYVLHDLYATIENLDCAIASASSNYFGETGLAKLHPYGVEVIVVDDHSTDRTVEIAESFGARVVKNIGKPGKGYALRTGFQASSGDIIIMMDADYSHRPEDLPIFLAALKEGVGLVIGSRVIGGSEEYTHIRALGNVFLSTALGLATGRYLSDALNGYKVFRREVYTDFKYTSKAFEIEIEIIANTLRKGYRVVEVSSHERARAGGVAKSQVIKHGTLFLARIIYEGLRGVKPIMVEDTAAAAVGKVITTPQEEENTHSINDPVA